MPRNANGVYSLPSGNPVVPGTLIESTWANPTMSDIGNELTQSLPRNGAAPMTGPLVLARDGQLPKEAVTVDQLTNYVSGNNSFLPAGAVQVFAMNSVPTGWLKCNGAAVSRSTYAQLFGIIGTTYGEGNGSTTFNVPDMRGMFLRGLDEGRSVDPNRVLGSQQNASNQYHNHILTDPGHTHTADQAPHTHGVTDPGHIHKVNIGAGSSGSNSGAQPAQLAQGVDTFSSLTGITIQSTDPAITVQASGTGIGIAAEGNEARPVNVAMCYCIKAFGALQTDGLGTMAFQNYDAVNITGGTGVFGSLQSTKTPTDPNDVVRWQDLDTGGNIVNIDSSDPAILLVDKTNPISPILRPQYNVAYAGVKLDANAKIPAALIPFRGMNYQGQWDASTGETPTDTYPSTVFFDGDIYNISVAGDLLVYDYTGTLAVRTVPIGSQIIYATDSGTFPVPGWYLQPAPTLSGATASQITFQPVGGISATDVQAALAEVDAEKMPKTGGTFTGAISGPEPTIAANLVTLNYLQTHAGNFVPITGGTMTGGLTVPALTVDGSYEGGEIQLRNTSNGDVATIDQVTDGTTGSVRVFWDSGAGLKLYSFGENGLTQNMGQSTAADSLTRKDYVDGIASSLTGSINGKMNLSGGTFTGHVYMAQDTGTPDNSYSIRFHNSFGESGYIQGRHQQGAWVGIEVYDGQGGIGRFISSGFSHTGNITAYSDRRLKTNLEVIPSALDKVQALTGYTFDRTDCDLRQSGLIAQDVQEVLPEVVTGIPDGDETYLGVNYGAMAGLFVEAIKELRAEVQSLRAEIAVLKGE